MTHETLRTLLLSTLVATSAACSSIHESDNEPAKCTNWKEDIGPLFASDCSSCHSGEDAAAGYRTTSYDAVLALGSDGKPTAVAGDANSPLLSALMPDDATHDVSADSLERIREWTVECKLRYSNSLVHGGGLMDPSSDEFHGAVLRTQNWNFGLCGDCHGSDFSGGDAKAACTTCHTDGPKACNVCHGSAVNNAPPSALNHGIATTETGVGAHRTHLLGGALDKPVACEECHVVPTSFEDPGHVFAADGSLDPAPAEVVFGAHAGLSIDAAEPTWDRTTNTCSSIYCHGDTLADDAGTNTQPEWTSVNEGQAACGTCHGNPPASHAEGACVTCHNQVVGADDKFTQASLHINGTVEIGDGSGECNACHGSANSAAPPNDLYGNTGAANVGVGAHQAHLFATRFRGPIPCSECHLVPTELRSVGHIDSALPAEVFPDGLASSSLGAADGASPIWDRNTGTCSSIYCHGGGAGLLGDQATGVNRSPSWAGGDERIECGSCHGFPPEDGRHQSYAAFTCATCHIDTMDENGSIIFSGEAGARTTTHINGEVDVY